MARYTVFATTVTTAPAKIKYIGTQFTSTGLIPPTRYNDHISWLSIVPLTGIQMNITIEAKMGKINANNAYEKTGSH